MDLQVTDPGNGSSGVGTVVVSVVDRDSKSVSDMVQHSNDISEDGQVSMDLPTDDLKPGTYFVQAIVTDMVGWTTEEKKLGQVTLKEPSEKPQTAAAANKKGVIKGRILFADKVPTDLSVTVQPVPDPAQADEKAQPLAVEPQIEKHTGAFIVRDLEAGKPYLVTANGNAIGRRHSTQKEVQAKPATSAKTIDFEI